MASICAGLPFLIFIHIYRFLFDYSSWKIDCSVPTMILFTKVVYLGQHLQNADENTPLPSFLQTLAYFNFFASALVGPTFSVPTFLNWVNSNKPKPFLGTLLLGIVFLGFTAVALPMVNKEAFLGQSLFGVQNVFLRLHLQVIVGFIIRCKYYTGFILNQAAANAMGLEVYCGSPVFQLEASPKDKTQHWNSSVQEWLKNCFYDPIAAVLKNQELAIFATFLVSAFWHGIYLSYYLGFMHWGIITNVSKAVYRKRALFDFLGPAKSVVAWYVGTLFLHYVGVAVYLLTLEETLQYCKSHYYYGTLLPLLALGALNLVKTPKAKGQ